ncbi:hypothetical protein SKP52_07930 [Sphingopyxis fribergensis]|uniref:Uncharacterized protein n=1 Tax=Sphingopyxis fribergensis TaxID=1515612 RepID=A0A0A7PEQ6_9SPHN|nr:group III truncated hemoglobin [Sphingopyxis fribergensis]AJA08505.1 hypothetical protein SKP52_07930 [Sphingopyxis fribergensis]
MTEPTLVDEDLKHLVTLFYTRVRADPQLGPVFNDVISDWPEHLDRITDFWSSVVFASGRYKGNPLAMHMLHADRITPPLFDRWLLLWADTTDALLPREAAAAVQARASRIAETLRAVICPPPPLRTDQT